MTAGLSRPFPDRGIVIAIGIAGLAFAIRIALVNALVGDAGLFDADGYVAQAEPALRGAPVDTTGHPPGYPWFLVSVFRLAGPSAAVLHTLQALLSAFAVLLVADAAARRWGPGAAAAAGLLLAFDAHAAFFPSILVSENLCLAGVAALSWLLVPPFPRVPGWRLGLAAVVVGALSLVRSGFLLFVPAIALVPFLAGPLRETVRRRRAWAVAIATGLVGSAVALAFPVYRSREAGGAIRLGSPLDAVMLWVGNNPASTGRYEEMPDRPDVGQPGIPDADALERVARDRASAFFREQPWRQADLVFRRASYLFAPPKRDLIYLYGHGWAGERPAPVVTASLAWLVLSFGVLAGAALAGLARAGNDGGTLVAAVLVLLVALPYLASVGDARYLHPAHPALALAGGAAFAHRAGPASPRRLVLALALGAVFAANAAWDVVASLPAMRAVSAPGGSTLRPPYHFAR